MKRWWLVIALLLSLGVNLGILATIAVDRERARPVEPPPERPPELSVEPRGPGLDGPGLDGPELDGPGLDGPEPARIPELMRHIATELGLEGEQRERFFALQRNFIENAIRARVRIWRLQSELREQLAARDPERAAIDPLVAELGRAHAELETVLVENIFATRELLDPEQQQRYLHLLARWRRGHGGMDGPPSRERPFGPPGERGPGRRRDLFERGPDRRPPEPEG